MPDVDDPTVPFSAATRGWFESRFTAPTLAQRQAWAAISAGEHTLVVAPTGSGKTLAAFLWSLDRLHRDPIPARAATRCRVVYVSPLKALAVDVEKNLRAPLAGIGREARRLGLTPPEIHVAMRSGDTPAEERRRFARSGADILITTPESLFLLLTSAARAALAGVETVIVDEIHAVCGGKRGSHLAVTLERLDALLPRPAQRVGLSATVRPVAEVARFLAGGRPVTVVQPPVAKQVELRVVVPVAELGDLAAHEPAGGLAQSDPARRASIWPHLEERLLELIQAHRSTIVFANSRRLAERLTARLNELAAERRDGAPLPPYRPPAELMAQSGSGHGVPASVARSHHGSMSREQRLLVEAQLKSGQLPAVVATGTLELGIDMGAVELVAQVAAPPSVAAGLQRVGRAGHHVGATSRGVIFPRHRGELLEAAVVAERMRDGLIEEIRYPRNPLDVLAQQIVAMVAVQPWPVAELAALLRRAAPYAELPDAALAAVLDMLAGRYPSDTVADLRPRIVYDRAAGVLSPRHGSQRLAVTSGGTIPDRGLFGVFLAGSGERPVRVGELDEEMVYESRVGDVFLLGSSSWRIEEITHDRVLVTPAPGQPGRMPFWKGDTAGRPVELGRAMGAFLRELAADDETAAAHRAGQAGLDELATGNLLAYLAEQRQATGVLPDDRTVVVERFHDELGDWRIVIHSPFGAPVNAPWGLAIAARLRERFGVELPSLHTDDGIVLQLPDTGGTEPAEELTGAELAIFDPDEIQALVTDATGGSALFAARFRECAARALLLPRHDPRRRSPLWQQRHRSARLLAVAAEHPEFPITLEAMRECLQDVFDLPGLVELMRQVAARRLRVVEVVTAEPSPFARSLLYGWVGAFVYDTDLPLAERRAQALTLDATLLAQLLGQAELRELLDPAAVAQVEAELGWRTPQRRITGVDAAHDALRILGDLTRAEASDLGATGEQLDQLITAGRALELPVAGQPRLIAIEDAGRYRDALGVRLPAGLPDAHTEAGPDPLADLVARYARCHGPFPASEVAHRFGLGVAVVSEVLHRLAAAGRLASGEFRPGAAGTEWCDVQVLRRLRRRSLAALRREVEPVPPRALARFLPAWHGVTATSGTTATGAAAATGSAAGAARGADAVLRVVEQLQGAPVPASALESLILPARVPGYAPPMLDELTTAGEVLWSGAGALPGADGWVRLTLADTAPLLLPQPEEITLTPLHRAVLEALADDQALFVRALAARLPQPDGQPPAEAELGRVLWELVWAGYLGNDTLAPLRAHLGGGRTAHQRPAAPRRARPARAGRLGRAGTAMLPPRGASDVAGRWFRLPPPHPDPTLRAHARAEALLERHGVVLRPAVLAERDPGGFAAVYPVLRAAEEAGRCRRGYFVAGLGAAQFATAGAVDRLRGYAAEQRTPAPALLLAATDPANPYGAALGWPERLAATAAGGGHRPGRKAGAVVVLVDGELVLYLERGGRSLLTGTDEPVALRAAAVALAAAVRSGRLGPLAPRHADGEPLPSGAAVSVALVEAGFRPTPSGLRLRG